MTSPLARASDALLDDQTPLATALMLVYRIASRVQADELAEWIRREVSGYHDGDDLPKYRRLDDAEIELEFENAWNLNDTVPLISSDLPEELRLGGSGLRQGVAEIETLASDKSPYRIFLGQRWMSTYRRLSNEFGTDLPRLSNSIELINAHPGVLHLAWSAACCTAESRPPHLNRDD